jgi:hypothetical protein
MEESKPKDEKEVLVVDPELVDLLADLEKEPAAELATVPEPVPAAPIPVASVKAEPEVVQEGADDVREILSNFRNIRNAIFENYKKDRDQAEEAIQLFLKSVRAGSVTQAVIDGYVKALGIKADINANAIGLLDSQARLLSAGKGGALFIQQLGISPKELTEILRAPPYPDEQQQKSETKA